MIWGLLVPAWLRRFVAWAVGGLAVAAGIFYAGKRDARQKAKMAALQGYKKTRKGMDDVQIDDDTGVLRDRLRTRDTNKR